ncbi:MAG: hypothetical protein LBH62_00715 [Nitrososphaerota archaeon]|jgi:cytoskeletal protein RodZ|nr:hypothetical protein [Nitrososphaerota archaeon]
MENSAKIMIAIAFLALIFGIIVAIPFLTGYASLPEILNRDGNSQVNPSTATTAPPTSNPNPTQKSTSATPSLNPDPTPTPTPTSTSISEITTTELTFGETVSDSITTTVNSNRYSVVLPQTGRLTLTVARDKDLGPGYLSIKLLDSDGVQIGGKDSHYLGGMMVNFNYNYVLTLDLDASTYYIEVANANMQVYSRTGVYYVQVDFTPF